MYEVYKGVGLIETFEDIVRSELMAVVVLIS